MEQRLGSLSPIRQRDVAAANVDSRTFYFRDTQSVVTEQEAVALDAACFLFRERLTFASLARRGGIRGGYRSIDFAGKSVTISSRVLFDYVG